MKSYIFYLFIFFVESFLSDYCYKKSINNIQNNFVKNLLYTFISSIPYIIISSIRLGIGTDYFSYQGLCSIIIGDRIRDFIEPGFALFVRFAGLISEDFRLIIILCAIVYSIALKNAIFKIAKSLKLNSVFFSVFVVSMLLFGPSLNVIRQAIAIALVSNALACLLENQNKGFFVFMILAVSFHVSAALFIPVILVKENFFSIKQFLIVISCGILLMFVWYHIDSLLSFYSNNKIVKKVILHLAGDNSSTRGFIRTILVYFPLLIPMMFFAYSGEKSGKDILFMNFFPIYIIVVIVSKYINFFYREIYYCYLPLVMLLALYLNKFKQKRGITTLLIIYFCLFFYRYFVVIGYDGIIPYNSILFRL